MIGASAHHMFADRHFSELDINAIPGLMLGE